MATSGARLLRRESHITSVRSKCHILHLMIALKVENVNSFIMRRFIASFWLKEQYYSSIDSTDVASEKENVYRQLWDWIVGTLRGNILIILMDSAPFFRIFIFLGGTDSIEKNNPFGIPNVLLSFRIYPNHVWFVYVEIWSFEPCVECQFPNKNSRPNSSDELRIIYFVSCA